MRPRAVALVAARRVTAPKNRRALWGSALGAFVTSTTACTHPIERQGRRSTSM
jgi:hypothetical protein